MKSHLLDNGLGILLFAWVAYQWCAGSVLYFFRGRGDSLEMCHHWIDREDHPVIFWIVLTFDLILAVIMVSV